MHVQWHWHEDVPLFTVIGFGKSCNYFVCAVAARKWLVACHEDLLCVRGREDSTKPLLLK